MKRTDLAYIAGIIDGEGCISVWSVASKKDGAKRHNIGVILDMSEKPAIELAQALFGGRIYHYPPRGHSKPISRWQVSGEKAEIMLRAIKPYLLVKRAQAEVALRLLSIHPRGRHYTPMERFLQEIDAKALKELKGGTTFT